MMTPNEAYEAIFEMLLPMGNAEREEVFKMLQDSFCVHCGGLTDGHRCQCTNDE